MHEKDVRDWLRMSDLLIARIQTGRPMPKETTVLLRAYLARLRSLLLTLEGYDTIQQKHDIIDDQKGTDR